MNALRTSGAGTARTKAGDSALRIATRRSQRRNGWYEKSSGSRHGELANQLAPVHIHQRRCRSHGLIEKARVAKLFERQRKQSFLWRNIEAHCDLCGDALGRPTALFEELEHAGSRRIEQMHAVYASIVNEHLPVERVLQETRGRTRKTTHFARGKRVIVRRIYLSHRGCANSIILRNGNPATACPHDGAVWRLHAYFAECSGRGSNPHGLWPKGF